MRPPFCLFPARARRPPFFDWALPEGQPNKKGWKKNRVIPCTKFHFRRYSTIHNIKKVGAALVRTIASYNSMEIFLR